MLERHSFESILFTWVSLGAQVPDWGKQCQNSDNSDRDPLGLNQPINQSINQSTSLSESSNCAQANPSQFLVASLIEPSEPDKYANKLLWAGRTKVPLCSTGLRPLRGRCPASAHSHKKI